MPGPFKRRGPRTPARMFETRSEAWAAVGLETEINRQEAQKALRRLPAELILLIAGIWGESIARDHFHKVAQNVLARHDNPPKKKPFPGLEHWFVGKGPITIVAVLLVLALGW